MNFSSREGLDLMTSAMLVAASSRRAIANPVRITYLIGSLARGGAEGQLLELLKRLERSRWHADLILFNDRYGDRASDINLQHFSLQIPDSGISRSFVKGIKAAAAIARLGKRLRQTRSAILHAFLPASFVLAVPAAKLARTPILIGSRRSLVNCYRNGKILARVDRSATRMCDHVVGNCHAVTEEIVRVDGVPSERTATIPNGVDTDKFRPGERGLRQLHCWSQNVVFGIVANFIPYKRHADFIRAAALISRQAPQARFVMTGEDRGILSELRCQIAAEGLESRFTIIPGTSKPEMVYPSLDAYICTSETEGLSNVLLEAAASGLPIIATDVGGNGEIVSGGENGYLVPVGEPEQIAAAALALIANPEQRARMGARSRQIVSQKFSLDVMVRQHEELYTKLLSNCRATEEA